MARFDVHRPSVIDPDDYEFVAQECIKIEGMADCFFIKAEREALRAHMAHTGGTYSHHDHGGNCGVCGNANAIYTAQFYHKKTNSYVRVGSECSEKLGYGGMDAFKSKCGNWLDAQGGKNKAKATLELAGIGGAWAIYEGEGASNEEATVKDIVGKLIKYGSISDKQEAYLGKLVERVQKAPEIAAARAAETAAAAPVPVVAGRMKVEGEVLTVKTVEGFYGTQTKMLVRHASGFKLWGTAPASIAGEVAKGDTVSFVAAVKASDDDPKFGFWSRPAQAKVLKQEVMA